MISICIPIFNKNITQLVNDLHSQAELLNVNYEILLFDDCSPLIECKEQNRKLASLSNVTYRELEQNIGRSAIRNLLATESKSKYILFIDCDAEICNSKFLNNYLPYCQPNIVCSGGCTYTKTAPSPEKYLRWYIGTKKEDRSASLRTKNCASQFTAFNLLIERKLVLSCPFDERIKQYGHEDTLLGIQLKKLGANFVHIDNPLIHMGIDTADDFLLKTKQAVINLLEIKRLSNSDDFRKSVRLLRIHDKMEKYHLIGLLTFILPKVENLLIKNLKGKKPRLLFFDLYKLNCLLTRKAEKKN